MLLENIKAQNNKIIIIDRKGLPLLVKISIEQDIIHLGRGKIFLPKLIHRELYHIKKIPRLRDAFPHLEHIPRLPEGLIAKTKPPLLIDQLQHVVDVSIVYDHEALRIGNRVAVLLQDIDAEAMEGVDIACVIVSCQKMNPLPHLICRLIREGHAENPARHDTELIDEIGKPVRQCPCLPGAGTRDHTDTALCFRHSLPLGFIQPFEHVLHPITSFANAHTRHSPFFFTSETSLQLSISVQTNCDISISSY